MKTPRILIVAGSDSGGGAGIQADIKTVTMLGGHAMTAITAITAQNTLGVQAVHAVPTDMVMAQIESCVSDIGVDAVKIGMIGSAETAQAVADRLTGINVPIVFDPVMIATSGSVLADADTITAFGRLMRIATVVTPNLPELAALHTSLIPVRAGPVEGRRATNSVEIDEGGASTGSARTGEDLARLCRTMILVKGGHADIDTDTDEITDTLFGPAGKIARWSAPRIATTSTHGTGCTLASAIATGLGTGLPLSDAIALARRFVRIALHEAPGFGAGHGPMGQQAVRLDGGASGAMLNQITVPLADYEASAAFYALLGLRQIVASAPRYARFEAIGGVTLSIEAAAEIGGRPMVYFECADLPETARRLRAAGNAVTIIRDRDWGWREARLSDPAGNALCLYQAGENRRFPPWRLPDA